LRRSTELAARSRFAIPDRRAGAFKRHGPFKALSLATFAGAIPIVIAAATPALAHNDEALTAQDAWSDWHFTPDIVIPTVLILGVYIAGVMRRRSGAERTSWLRAVLFVAGVAAVVLALQSPIDPIAERLFWMHQIQHFLLRMIGPMLIALSWPAASLVAGLPKPARRGVLAPVAGNAVTRAVFAVAGQPFVATALFILALYVWEIPRYHNVALLNESVHYLMHATMLAAGLIFWQRIFDRRPSPQGLKYGVRLMMLWLVALSNIALGAYTTLKPQVLYHAYDTLGRLYDMPALVDEQLGGAIIWIPSSMMCLVAILIVIHWWGVRETRLDARWSAAPAGHARTRPATAAALIEQSRPKNRSLAIGMATFVTAVFAAVLVIGAVSQLPAFDADASHASHHASGDHIGAAPSG
jgi:putative membrane protein